MGPRRKPSSRGAGLDAIYNSVSADIAAEPVQNQPSAGGALADPPRGIIASFLV